MAGEPRAKRARADEEEGVAKYARTDDGRAAVVPDVLVHHTPALAAAAVAVKRLVADMKGGAPMLHVPAASPAAVLVARRELTPLRLAPLLAALAAHPAVRARVRGANAAALELSDGAPYAPLAQVALSPRRAFAAACRLPAARLMCEEPRQGWPAGACHFAPASVTSVELCNLLVYADALRRAWLVVDGGRVGVLVEPEMD